MNGEKSVRKGKFGKVTKFVGLWLPLDDYNRLAELVKKGRFRNISDAIRFAVKYYLDIVEKPEFTVEKKPETENVPIAGIGHGNYEHVSRIPAKEKKPWECEFSADKR